MAETPRERIERIKKQDKKREKEKLKLFKSKENVIKVKLNEKNLLGVALLKLKGQNSKEDQPRLTERQINVLKSGKKPFLSRNKYFEHYHDFVKAPNLAAKEEVLVDLKKYDHIHCFSHITKKCMEEVENAKRSLIV